MKKKLSVQKHQPPLLCRVVSVICNYNLLQKHDKVIVAVSGGSDSLALLYILHSIDLPLNLVAVYVDHGLRPNETLMEKKSLQQYCNSLHIPLIIRSADVYNLAAKEKRSQEEAARVLRYKILENIRRANEAKVIAIGHTADDQVEEFFIRLIRGSSRKGLSGMSVRRDTIIRPLLFEEKETLSNYLNELGVSWCFDSSNSSRKFLRNRVRLDLLPKMENEFNPAIRKTILQNMDILSEENNFLEEITNAAYTRSVEHISSDEKGENSSQLLVKGKKVVKIHPAIGRRILEKIFWQMGIRPTYDQINTLLQFIKTAENGKEIHLTKGVRAEKRGNDMILGRPLRAGLVRGSRETPPPINQSVNGPGIHHIVETGKELILKEMAAGPHNSQQLRVDLGKITYPLLLRSSTPGQRFHPYGGPGKKKISRYLNEQKIPAAERPAWPVLLCGEKVVALPGLQIDHNYRITDETVDILVVDWIDCKKKTKE